MAIAARLATEVPQVSSALRSAFRVVLLDEYQDTSAAQAIMLRGLFSGSTPSDGLGHPVTAVGDPFQAIYGWRGAAASNITTFADGLPPRGRPAGARFALTVNRRSGRTILDVANVLSRPLRPNGSTSPFGLPIDGDSRASDCCRHRRGPPPAWSGPRPSTPGRRRSAGSRPDRAGSGQRRGPRWADIAVLTRRNADIAPLYAELTARDVPVEIVGLGGLLHLPEVMDVTATLRLVDDVTANPDLIRLLTGPRWRIGPRDLALLGRRARELARAAPERGEASPARN